MASRIEDALEPVFTEYTATHEIPNVEIPQPPPVQAPRAPRSKSSKRKSAASASEPEPPKQKRVKILVRKKGDTSSPQSKAKKIKKPSKIMTPPRNESSDSEHTLSSHGASDT